MSTFWSAEEIQRMNDKGINTAALNLNQPLPVVHNTPAAAFAAAIATGRLSTDRNAQNWCGHYMYMGPSADGLRDAFKHIDTRQYIK